MTLAAALALAGCGLNPIQIGPADLDTTSAAAPQCYPVLYPGDSKLKGDRGVAVVKVEVGADGSIASVALDTSTSYTRLDEVALDAARHCRFRAPQQPHTARITFVWDLIAKPGATDLGVTRVGIQPRLQ